VCRSKNVEPSINFEIINSITKLHLVGISTESSICYWYQKDERERPGKFFKKQCSSKNQGAKNRKVLSILSALVAAIK